VEFEYSAEKDIWLKKERGLGFEEVIQRLRQGNVVGIVDNANQHRYPGQRVYMVDVNGYIYAVPYVRNGDQVFLKTIYPTRKATKFYRNEGILQ